MLCKWSGFGMYDFVFDDCQESEDADEVPLVDASIISNGPLVLIIFSLAESLLQYLDFRPGVS